MQPASTAFRIRRWSYKAYKKHIPVLPRLLKRINRILFACEIPPSAELEEGCSLVHNGLGVVIHGQAVVGAGTRILQNVTIGGRGGCGALVIGHNVLLG